MRIALVYPRTKKDARGLSAMPLGVLILGTIIEKEHIVKVFDASFDNDVSSTFERIKEFNPDIVGVSLLTPFYSDGKKLTELSKQEGYITVWGGPHPTILPIESLSENECLDFIVIGEGEYSFPNLLRNINTPQKVKGIGFKDKEGKIVINHPEEKVKEIDLNVIPNRTLLETLPKYLETKIMNIITYRGCPFNCGFCQPTLRKLFGNGWRIRNPENVVKELKMLNEKYHPRSFLFSDDTFTANQEWVKKFVKILEKSKLKLKFDITTRVNKNILTEESVRLLKSVGLYKISFGVESGSQIILDNLDKNTTIPEIERAFKLCKKYKIDTHAFIMLGSLGETKDTLKQTEEFLTKINPTTVNISIFTPQIGTDLYNKVKGSGLLRFNNMRQSDYYSWEFNLLPIKNEGISFRDVIDCKKRIIGKRRLSFIFYNLKQELKDPSLKRIIYALKEFNKRKDKG